MLETGVYPIALLDFVMGQAPESMRVLGELSPGGAERQVDLLCSYSKGATLAHLHCGLTVGTPARLTLPKINMQADSNCARSQCLHAHLALGLHTYFWFLRFSRAHTAAHQG